MDIATTSGLVQDNGDIGNSAASTPTNGETRETISSYESAVKNGSEASQILSSKKHPLGSANSSNRVLRSTSKNKNNASSELIEDTIAVQSASIKRKRGRPSKKDKAPSEPVNDTTAVQPAGGKRKRGRPSKKDKAPSEPVNDTAAVQPAGGKRKRGRPSKSKAPSEAVNNNTAIQPAGGKRKIGRPSKNKAPSDPVNDNTAIQPAGGKRKRGRPSKKKAPSDPVNDNTAIQPAGGKRKRGRPSKNRAPSETVNGNTAVQPAAGKRKRGRPSKSASPKNEYIRIRQRIRYILNRMNYEQSFIQAYASEGWKGQSLEKLRPEKELERAKMEILRCKFRIREAFQKMDSLLSEGKLEESLFDSAGEISSEDIFCAICSSKHVTLRNDIVLCDGVCDRGFHQKCLSPPLMTEDIPLGDEGWLCPACDCKIDCIDVLNELQGSKLSIHDSWEKVFPEAALLADGSKQINMSDLPSDDSEDNDYDPALAEGHMMDEDKSSAENGGGGSDSDDSDFITSSEDSEPSKKKTSESSKSKRTVDDLGLPSEDSEDDDFDPAGPDSSEDQKNKSNSDDFSSDSDDFCAEIAKSCDQDEVLSPALSDHTDKIDNEPVAEDSNRASMETELEQDMVLSISSRREVERLDYKKLYDEAYGKESSDSSDDDEWSGNSTPSEGIPEDCETDSLAGSHQPAQRSSRRAQAGQQNSEHTPQRERVYGSENDRHTEVLCSNGSNSTGRKKHFGPMIKQKLKVYFKEDPYPSRATKESLAQELGLTFNQVCRWFSSTRHYTRISGAKKQRHPENCTTENNDRTAADSVQPAEPNVMVMDKPTMNIKDEISEERMAQNNVNGDISCQHTVVVAPPAVDQNCTNSSEVGSPIDIPGKSHRSGSSKNVASPKGGSAVNKIPGLEHVDEARRKAILRELRKKKTGR